LATIAAALGVVFTTNWEFASSAIPISSRIRIFFISLEFRRFV
jgi:hypothetical protein